MLKVETHSDKPSSIKAHTLRPTQLSSDHLTTHQHGRTATSSILRLLCLIHPTSSSSSPDPQSTMLYFNFICMHNTLCHLYIQL